jgi:hypothetical protein
MSDNSSNNNHNDKPPIFRTRIEQRFKEKLEEEGLPLPIAEDGAWYFSANFGQTPNGAPLGYLRRYEKGDVVLHPHAETPVVGQVVGDVRFEGGRALFGGNGHIEFHITQAHVQALDEPKLNDTFLTPKPLIMLGVGQVDRAAHADANYANPVLYYRCGESAFGLFVPDGSLVSKINLEVVRATTGYANRDLQAAVWYAHIEQAYKKVQSGKRFRYAHEIMDGVTLDYLSKREFFLYEPFLVTLKPGAVFYVGNAPLPGVTPLRGWLEEVVFDPAGGTHNGGGKPQEI